VRPKAEGQLNLAHGTETKKLKIRKNENKNRVAQKKRFTSWCRAGYKKCCMIHVKLRPHQQQRRSNIVECYKSNDSFDKVACCFDIVAVFGNNVSALGCYFWATRFLFSFFLIFNFFVSVPCARLSWPSAFGRTLIYRIISYRNNVEQKSRNKLFHARDWWVTTYVGKPSAIGQPTRPTKPFILPRSIN